MPQTGGGFLGTEIRDARRQKGITVIELAAEMGVSLRYLIRLEKGEIAAIPEQIELIRSIIDGWPCGRPPFHFDILKALIFVLFRVGI